MQAWSRNKLRNVPSRIIFIFLVLAFGIIAAGYFSYITQKNSIKQETGNNLSAIADLKVQQIVNWRNERIGDAKVIQENSIIANYINRWLNKPDNNILKQPLLQWMNSLANSYDYQSILILDNQGKVRLTSNKQDNLIGEHAYGLFQQVIKNKQPILSDFHKTEQWGVHLDLLVPILAQARNESECIAVILLRINPYKNLYPLIQTWPTPSSKAETLLIRKERDFVLFLNELRHQKNTALTLRLSIGNENLPAAMAAKGKVGIVEGLDYRNIPVLAAVRQIPESPWYMVAKDDQEEIYIPIQRRAIFITIITGLMILICGAIIIVWWREQRIQFYRSQYKSELERKALVSHFEYLVKYANDIILLIDDAGKLIEVNDRAVSTYGNSREELLGMNIQELRAPESLTMENIKLREQAQKNGLIYEAVHKRKDGTTFPVEASVREIKVESEQYLQLIIRDITDRKKAEEALIQSHERIRRFIDSNIIGVVIVAPDGKVIEANDYYLRTIGYTREEFKKGLVDWRAITPQEWIPADEQAIKELRDRGVCTPYEKEYIRRDGTKVSVFLSDTMLPGPGEQIAAFVLDTTERKKAEIELRKREELLQITGNMAKVGGWEFDVVTHKGTWTAEVARIHELDPGLETNVEIGLSFYQGDSRVKIEQAIKEVIEFGKPYDVELEMTTAKGNHKWVRSIGKPIKQGDKVIKLTGSFQDITDRKQIENELVISNDFLEKTMDLSPLSMWISDDKGTLLQANQALRDALNVTDKQIVGSYNVFEDQNLVEQGVMSQIESVFNKGIPTRFIIPWQASKGGEGDFRGAKDLFIDVSMFPIKNTKNKVCNVVCQWIDITDLKLTEESLRDKLSRLQVLKMFYETLALSLDLKQVFQKVYELIPKYLNVNRASLFLYDENVNGLISDHLIGVERPGQISDSAPQPIGYSISGKCFQEAKTILINDCSQTDLIPQRYIELLNLKSTVAVPIISKQKVIGVLRIDDCDRINRFTEADIELYSMIAEQLAIIIENARLFTERKQVELVVQEQNTRLLLQNRVAQIAISSKTISEFSDQLLAVIRELMPCDAFFVDKYDNDMEYVTVVKGYDTINGTIRELELTNIAVKPIGEVSRKVISERKPYLNLRKPNELEENPPMLAGDTSRRSASLLYIPLVVHDHIIGKLSIQSYQPEAYTTQHIETLMAIVPQISPAFESLLLGDQLRKSEEKYRNIHNNAAIGIYQSTPEGRYLSVNPAVAKIFGYNSPEEMIREVTDISNQLFVHPEDRKRYRELLDQEGAVYNFEAQYYRKDGTKVWTSVNARTVRNTEGNILYYEGTAEDITERKQAEEALKYSESFLDSIIEHSAHAMWVSDAQGTLIRVNQALCDLIHIERDEVIGKYNVLRDNIVEEQGFMPLVKQVFEQGETVKFRLRYDSSHLNYLALRRTKYLILDVTISAVLDASGKVTNAIIQHMDMTEQILAEETLKDTAERLNEAQHIGHIGSWELELTTNILTWSDEIYRIFEFDPKEFTPSYEAFLDAIHPDDRNIVNAAYSNSLKNHTPYTIDHRLLLSDGRIKYIHEQCETVYEHEKPIRSIGTIQDITERKQAEEEVRKLNTELEQRVKDRTVELEAVNKELEAFSYSVSHDLRAPLRSIAGFSNILLEDYAAKLDEEGKNHLQRVITSTERMGQLIDDMLALSRVTRKEMILEEVDLSQLAESIFTELHAQVPEQTVEFRFIPDLKVVGDPILLSQLLENLLENALKFTKNRDGAIIELGKIEQEGHPVYFVRDNGAGFDMQYSHKLFQPFQRLHRIEEYPGTGIGLATVRRIISRHNGKIWAEGALGKGATFYFTI